MKKALRNTTLALTLLLGSSGVPSLENTAQAVSVGKGVTPSLQYSNFPPTTFLLDNYREQENKWLYPTLISGIGIAYAAAMTYGLRRMVLSGVDDDKKKKYA